MKHLITSIIVSLLLCVGFGGCGGDPDAGSCCLGTEFDTSISIFRVSDARFDIFVHYSDV